MVDANDRESSTTGFGVGERASFVASFDDYEPI